MLKSGALILSIWCLLNVLPAAGSLLFIALGNHAPALRMRFQVEEIPELGARTLGIVDGLAILLNTLIAVYCASAFFVIRRCLLKGERWSLIVLASGIFILQIAAHVSDRCFFGGNNALALNISSFLLLIGFGLSAAGIFKKIQERAVG